MLARHIALSLEEQSQLSMHGSNSKINKIIMNTAKKSFHQEKPVIASHKEGTEKVQGISESDLALTYCLMS